MARLLAPVVPDVPPCEVEPVESFGGSVRDSAFDVVEGMLMQLWIKRPPWSRGAWRLIVASLMVLSVLVLVPTTSHAESGGKSNELFYRAGDGVSWTGSVADDGVFHDLRQVGGFAPGWTHISPAGDNRLLFYRQSDGLAATGSVDSNTGVFTELRIFRPGDGFAAGWTHITFAGGDRLLFYRQSDGVAATGRVSPDGGITTLRTFTPGNGFIAGWTHITPVGGNRLLFYRQGDGTAATGAVDDQGGFTTLQTFAPGKGFAPGWTHISQVGGTSGSNAVLFYRAGDGAAATGAVAADGGFTTLQVFQPGNGFAPGWTHIVPAGGNRLLFYRTGDGAAASGAVAAGGDFFTLQVYQPGTRFAAGWSMIVTTRLEVPANPTFTLEPSVTDMTINWRDGTVNETGWDIYKRNSSGSWVLLTTVPTRNTPATTDLYSFVDRSTDVSGQCYYIAVKNAVGPNLDSSNERCNVRTDPAAFPQMIPTDTQQWSVSVTAGQLRNGENDWQLFNATDDRQLVNNATNGVDMEWVGGDSHLSTRFWEIRAQGGPKLVKGQLVALKAGNGGWLHVSGLRLTVSSTPTYEWRSLGSPLLTGVAIPPNTDPDIHKWWPFGRIALWNDIAKDFLVRGDNTTGGPGAADLIDLNWYRQTLNPPPPGTQFNTTLTMVKQTPLSFFTYLGSYPSFGSVPPFHLVGLKFPQNSFTADEVLAFVKPGHNTEQCGDANAVVLLAEGQSLTPAQITALYGSSQPHFTTATPLVSVACWNGPAPVPGFINLEITLQND